MPRPEMPPERRVREIRMHGLSGGLGALIGGLPPRRV
jgi:hypothetical protein